jgi:hypothetical protein
MATSTEVSLGRGESSDQEDNGQRPWDVPEEGAVSDQTTSPPPLEDSDEEVPNNWLPGQLGGVGREQGWRRLGERGNFLTLNQAIASWDQGYLAGRHLEPRTIARLETTVKDYDMLRLGAGRVRSQRDVGDTVHDVCASLRFNEYLIAPAEMMNGTAGNLKLSLSYPNLFNLIVQVRDLRV